MADAWSLVTPGGTYQLNQTFAAPKYQAGGVSGPGALRRDGRSSYQRSGDGLATPGPLVLVGRVWRDDLGASAIVNELNAIRDAVAACTQVIRTTSAGAYAYDGLSGGPTPEITPDGLGGWLVRLDLWPQRATPTFVPAPDPVEPVTVLAAAVTGLDIAGGLFSVPVPDAPAPAGATLLVVLASGTWGGGLVNASGFTNVNGAGNLAPLTDDLRRVWAFHRLLVSPASSIAFEADGDLWGTAHVIVISGAVDIADLRINTGVRRDPHEVAGAATTPGTQLFFGGLEEYGLT